MRYISFGSNHQNVSEVVMGLMRISRMMPSEVARLIETGLDHGINALDTADCYTNGKCEAILGEALACVPGLRNRVFLQTKCGIRPDGDFTWFDFSKAHILEAVDASLARLKTDHVDSLLLHRPDALMEPDEIAEAFTILHDAGKVLDFGVSNMNPAMINLLKKSVHLPISVNQLQLSCAYTPSLDAGFNVNMTNDASVMHEGGILEYCRANDIVIQAWSPMQYGMFQGVFLGSDRYPKLNAVLDRIAAEQETTPTAVALAWILRYPGRVQVVTGTTRESRIIDSAAACDVTLSKKQWYEIYLSAGNVLP